MGKADRPVIIELDETGDLPGPDTAPPVPDTIDTAASGQAMQTAMRLATRRTGWLTRWFLRLTGALVGFAVSLWAWDAVMALLDRSPILGGIAVALAAAFLATALAIILRELSAFARLRRLDRLQRAAVQAVDANDLQAATGVADALLSLYRRRPELEWAEANFAARRDDALDADTLLGLAETELLAPLDEAARRQIELASRRVATATALVPLALADVVVALTANIAMIRRVAEIYGGHSGTLGSWRLARNVLAHLIATGAVAVGDDLIGSIAGGGVLSKVSRRFGEGVINGALTARVGLAAMEVCRPLPFAHTKRPSVSRVVQKALAGLFRKS